MRKLIYVSWIDIELCLFFQCACRQTVVFKRLTTFEKYVIEVVVCVFFQMIRDEMKTLRLKYGRISIWKIAGCGQFVITATKAVSNENLEQESLI